MKKLIALLAAVAILGITGPANAAKAKYEMRLQAAQGVSSIYSQVLIRLGKRIERLSQGQIKVEVLGEGAIAKDGNILDVVVKGVVEAGQAWTHYWSGKHPAGVLFAAPTAGLGLGLDQMSVVSWLWEGDGQKLLNEYYQKQVKADVKAYCVMPMGPEPFGWFKQSYKTLDEIRKVKFRSPPGVPSQSFKELGMAVVSMPGPDIVPSAQRGVIDAAEWIGPADDMILGMHEVWKHFYLQGLHQVISIGDIIVNKTWFDKLPKHLQNVIDDSMYATIADMSLYNISANSKALRELVTKHNVVIENTPPDYVEAYMAAALKVNKQFAEKDAFYAKVFNSLKEWAEMTVPYQTRSNGIYYMMNKTAMDKGIITDYVIKK